jgi:hypothetical protein
MPSPIQRLLTILFVSLVAPAALFVMPQAAGAHRTRLSRHHHRHHRRHAIAKAGTYATPLISQSPSASGAGLPSSPTPAPTPTPPPNLTAPTTTTTIGALGSTTTASDLFEPQFLAPTSLWNTPLAADAPLDPTSSELSASVANMAATYPTGFAVMDWSTPIYIVPANQPTVYMHLNPNPATGQVNAILQAAFTAVPVPADAQPAAGTDNMMVIYQPSTDTMWETGKNQLETDGWHFNYGGRMIHFSQNPGYYQKIVAPDGTVLEEPFWGNSASGLPLADRVVTFRDLANGYIDHALGLMLPHTWVRGGVKAWPAARTDGISTDPNSVPEGARFRLDPNLDINSLNLPPLTRMIALAAQRYGLIVCDSSGNITIDGQVPRTPDQTALWQQTLAASGFQYWSQVLKSFPWSHLQLLQMSLSTYH